MKIMKEMSREYKGKPYFKYKINIPEGAIERAKLQQGQDLEINAEIGKIILSKKGADKREFSGARSRLYKEALKEFPKAREQDIEIMKKYLNPKGGERILEIGAGSGFFSKYIADLIGERGRLIASDPSLEQLEEIAKLRRKNIDVIRHIQFGSKDVNLKKDKVDAVWSFGAMHHSQNKQGYMEMIKKILKENGRVVICDVFTGSKLAKHFDDRVAKYCVTGHEVAFWTREFAETICFLNGFEKPKFYDLNIKWKFKEKQDIGRFLYKLHAMTKTSEKEVLKGAEKILGIRKNKKSGLYELNWPMTLFITRKT